MDQSRTGCRRTQQSALQQDGSLHCGGGLSACPSLSCPQCCHHSSSFLFQFFQRSSSYRLVSFHCFWSLRCEGISLNDEKSSPLSFKTPVCWWRCREPSINCLPSLTRYCFIMNSWIFFFLVKHYQYGVPDILGALPKEVWSQRTDWWDDGDQAYCGCGDSSIWGYGACGGEGTGMWWAISGSGLSGRARGCAGGGFQQPRSGLTEWGACNIYGVKLEWCRRTHCG